MDILNQKFVIRPDYNPSLPELWDKFRGTEKFNCMDGFWETNKGYREFAAYFEVISPRFIASPQAADVELKLITHKSASGKCSAQSRFSEEGLHYVNPWISLAFFFEHSELCNENHIYGIEAPFNTTVKDRLSSIHGYYYGVRQESGSVLRAELVDFWGDKEGICHMHHFRDFYLGSETEGLT